MSGGISVRLCVTLLEQPFPTFPQFLVAAQQGPCAAGLPDAHPPGHRHGVRSRG